MDTPKLSLITGTLNRESSLKRLIDSIQKHTSVDWELVIADASDVPFVYDDPRVRILPERPRLGYVAGHNRAFKECRGEFVLFLNDDAEVCPNYDKAAIDFMERNPRIGIGALYYSNQGMPACVNEYFGMPYANFGIIRRELGDKIGWFPEFLNMYGSDNALTFEVLLAGYGVAGIPGAQLIHHETDDAARTENQIGRELDADKLHAHYYHRLREMQTVYENCLWLVAR